MRLPATLPDLAVTAEDWATRLETSELATSLLTRLGYDVPGAVGRLRGLAADAWKVITRRELARSAVRAAEEVARDLAREAYDGSGVLRELLTSAVVRLGTREAEAAVQRIRGQLRSRAPRFEGALNDQRGVVAELTNAGDDLAGGFGDVDVHGDAAALLARLEEQSVRMADAETASETATAEVAAEVERLRDALIDVRKAWRTAQRVSRGTLPDL